MVTLDNVELIEKMELKGMDKSTSFIRETE
jgi:hypothetical protein